MGNGGGQATGVKHPVCPLRFSQRNCNQNQKSTERSGATHQSNRNQLITLTPSISVSYFRWYIFLSQIWKNHFTFGKGCVRGVLCCRRCRCRCCRCRRCRAGSFQHHHHPYRPTKTGRAWTNILTIRFTTNWSMHYGWFGLLGCDAMRWW